VIGDCNFVIEYILYYYRIISIYPFKGPSADGIITSIAQGMQLRSWTNKNNNNWVLQQQVERL